MTLTDTLDSPASTAAPTAGALGQRGDETLDVMTLHTQDADAQGARAFFFGCQQC